MGKSDGASSAHAGGTSSKPKSSSSSASALAKANGSSTFSSSSGSNSGGAGGGNSAMIGSEAALKLKNLKGIHEDDGDNDESDDAELLPMDAQLMKFILESMGAEKHDPRVVNQLQEFVHRYVTEILLDAQEYSLYAEKQTLDADDIRLAIASRLNHHYAQLPSRELTMELAEKRNSIPLPPISNEYGVRLPPLQYQLVTQESDHQDPKLTNASRDDIFTESEGLAMDDGAMMARPPLHPGEGSRNKRVARNQIPIHFNQR